MSAWKKYLIYQVPGWFLVTLILIMLRQWLGLSLWIAAGIFLLWVIKDFALYPLLRKSFESGGKTAIEQLIGLHGVARERIDPCGYIHVRGEIWRAEIQQGDDPIPAGSPVRVVAAKGMLLIVTSEDKNGE